MHGTIVNVENTVAIIKSELSDLDWTVERRSNSQYLATVANSEEFFWRRVLTEVAHPTPGFGSDHHAA
jgi:hypothetical protein